MVLFGTPNGYANGAKTHTAVLLTQTVINTTVLSQVDQ